MVDLTQVPDEDITREYMRRHNARRNTKNAGRPMVFRPCPTCGEPFPAAELRKHKPICGKKEHDDE